MKRLFVAAALAAALLVCAPAAWAAGQKIWQGNTLSSTYDTAAGATLFAVEGVSGVTVYDLGRYDQELLFLQVESLHVNTALTPAYTDATATYSVYWRESMTRAGLATAELHAVLINSPVVSGVTPTLTPFRNTRAAWGQLLFKSSCTAWQTPNFIVGYGRSGMEAPVQVVSEGTFTMPAAGTGVSQFTSASIGAWPAGAEYAEFMLASGTSCYYTTNADTPAAGTGLPLYMATVLPLSKNEAKALKMVPGATATTIRYRLLNRQP